MFRILSSFDGSIENIISILAYIIVFVISLSFHELAHAIVAYKNGDNTPYIDGRISLNPMKHMDIYGFLCCLLFQFGWAKPVRVNPLNYRNYKKGMIQVSLAGIGMNFFLAFIGCGIFTLLDSMIFTSEILYFIYIFAYYLFMINISLGIFNLLPIYPLDGFMFLSSILKYDNKFVQFMTAYGHIILIVLLIGFDWIIYSLISIISIPYTLFWNFMLR